MIGATLGTYRVLDKLGEGKMGSGGGAPRALMNASLAHAA